MSEKRLSDEAVNQLVAELQNHELETFYVTYREHSKQLAKELETALRKAQWNDHGEVVNLDAPLPDQPEVEIETTTREPERGVEMLLGWLEGQDISTKHNYHPDISAVAIHVESPDG